MLNEMNLERFGVQVFLLPPLSSPVVEIVSGLSYKEESAERNLHGRFGFHSVKSTVRLISGRALDEGRAPERYRLEAPFYKPKRTDENFFQ